MRWLFWMILGAATATGHGGTPASWVSRCRRRDVVVASSSSSENAVLLGVPASQPPAAPTRIVWEEVMEETIKNEDEEEDVLQKSTLSLSSPSTTTTTLRQRVKLLLGIPENKKPSSISSSNKEEDSFAVNQQQPESEEEEEEPHPLRTRLWEFQVHWRGPAANHNKKAQQQQQHRSLYDCTRLVMEFDPSGYVRLQPANTDNNNNISAAAAPDDDSWMATGTWSVEATGGVSCSIPIPVSVSSSSSNSNHASQHYQQQDVLLQHRFEADLHLNPFGTHAKLTRGVIVRDRPHRNHRRDVVGTFSGRGSGGPDTVDLSYAARSRPSAPRSG